MEITNKDKKLLVYLLAIALIAGTYFFAARPFMDKHESISMELDTLRQDVKHYNDIYINKGGFEQQIADSEARYIEEMAAFESDIVQENTIMMLRDIEKNTGVWFSRVSFQDMEAMNGEIPSQESEAEGTEEVSSSVATGGRMQGLTLDYSIEYTKLKDFLKYVNEYDRRLYISSMNTNYSIDTNTVTGSLTLYQYALVGSGEEERPDLSNISVGKDNVFSNYRFDSDDTELILGTLDNGDAADNSIVAETDLENGDESEGQSDSQNQESEGDQISDDSQESEAESEPDPSESGRRRKGDF